MITEMKIFPAIDLKDGKCVRLTKGDFEKINIYNEDPISQAEIFFNVSMHNNKSKFINTIAFLLIDI